LIYITVGAVTVITVFRDMFYAAVSYFFLDIDKVWLGGLVVVLGRWNIGLSNEPNKEAIKPV
jgi:hypothetical protein